MIKIEIKNRFRGSVIFEYSKENNTIKETLFKAIQEGADLSGANLSYADLSDADLSYADLSGADLRGTNLRGINLRGTNLSYANLSYADLIGADLSGANLSYADLSGADLSYADLSGADLPIFCRWAYSIVNNDIKIGCKKNTIEGWESFFKSDETYKTERDTQEFKQIQAVFEACKAYLNFLNK